jgi:hypothetical protein
MIGQRGLLLIVSHQFVVVVLVLRVMLKKRKEVNLDVRNIFARSHIKHCWKCPNTPNVVLLNTFSFLEVDVRCFKNLDHCLDQKNQTLSKLGVLWTFEKVLKKKTIYWAHIYSLHKLNDYNLKGQFEMKLSK